jgi:hypothetical protein
MGMRERGSSGWKTIKIKREVVSDLPGFSIK